MKETIQAHLAHGVELHLTAHKHQIAEFRCEGCNQHLGWATQKDVAKWKSYGAQLKSAVSARDNLRLVQS